MVRLVCDPHFGGEKDETQRGQCLFKGCGASEWQKLDWSPDFPILSLSCQGQMLSDRELTDINKLYFGPFG